HEPLDRRAVEHDVAGERLLELRRRNLDVLVDAEYVRELQTHEAHTQLLGQLEDVVDRRAGSFGCEGAGVRRRIVLETAAGGREKTARRLTRRLNAKATSSRL